MQFTGLFDKNGKDWWEGDIVQVDDPEDASIAVIEYRGPSFIKMWDNGVIGQPIDHLDLGSMTVIGNRFENPELLKETTS